MKKMYIRGLFALAGACVFFSTAVASAQLRYGGQTTAIPVGGGEELESATHEVRIQAELYRPSGELSGSYPVIVMLHGHYASCAEDEASRTEREGDKVGLPCDGDAPIEIESFAGYREVGMRLAQEGFVVVSINGASMGNEPLGTAPGAHDFFGIPERAALIEHHLQLLTVLNGAGCPGGAEWCSGVAELKGHLDLHRLGLMGHSRGGEAVVWHYTNQQELLAAGEPRYYTIRAAFLVAPTANVDVAIREQIQQSDPRSTPLASRFPELVDYRRITDIPVAVLQGYCDESITGLAGLQYFDDVRYTDDFSNAPRHVFLVPGANHNFFNSQWLLDDADNAPDPGLCDSSASGTVRIGAGQQRDVLTEYMSRYFEYYIQGSMVSNPEFLFGDFAGAEEFPQLIDGVDVITSYHPPQGQRRDINRYNVRSEVNTNTLGGSVSPAGAAMCGGEDEPDPETYPNYEPVCREGGNWEPYQADGVHQTVIPFSSSTTTISNAIPSSYQDFSEFEVLHLRAAFVPGADWSSSLGTIGSFSVRVNETELASIHSKLLPYPHRAFGYRRPLLNSIRLPFSGYLSTDEIQSVSNIELVLEGAGDIGKLNIADLAVSSTIDTSAADVVLVIDDSGSMREEDDRSAGFSRSNVVLDAAELFLQLLQPDDTVAIVSYSDTSAPPVDFYAPNSTETAEALTAIRNDPPPSGPTSIGAGIDVALKALADLDDPNRRKSILLLTDGRQNTAPCLEGEAGTGECDPGGLPVIRSEAFKGDTKLCSIGVGPEGSTDLNILNEFSKHFYDASSGKFDNNSVMSAFAKCSASLSADGLAVDPSGILRKEKVSAPAFEYESCADRGLNFAGGWLYPTRWAGDMRLMVTDPSGALLQPNAEQTRSLTQNFDVQRAHLPERGKWRFQVARDHTRIVNGFASNAFEDQAAGVALARQQIQRLCPSGCDRVLYFEDGQLGSAPSIYAQALTLDGPGGTGLIGSVTSYDQSDAAIFSDEVAHRSNYDLLIYIRQLDDDPSVIEPYDPGVGEALCYYAERALITDMRRTSIDEETWGAGNFHRCSGAYPATTGEDYLRLVDSDGSSTLLDAALTLENPGYPTLSYGISAIPYDRAAAAYEPYWADIGATQLEAGIPGTFLQEIEITESWGDLVLEAPVGSIVTHSADGTYYPSEGSRRTRVEQEWFSQVNFTGMTPLIASAEVHADGNKFILRAMPEGLVPQGRVENMVMWVDTQEPTEDLADVFSSYGCGTVYKPDDPNSAAVSLNPEDIPLKRGLVGLNDNGIDGDEAAGDGIFSGTLPAAYEGTYALAYFMEYDFTDSSGETCRVHREQRLTGYLGSPIPGGDTLCTASNPSGGLGPNGNGDIFLGDDPADCPPGYNIIIGTEGDDILVGTDGPDCMLGLGGNDVMEGGDGIDIMSGGDGIDIMNGGDKDDVMFGGAGPDDMDGGRGKDIVNGGPDGDYIDGGEDADEVNGEDGDDFVNGGASDGDIVDGGPGIDVVNGDDGTGSGGSSEGGDAVHGGPGVDTCGDSGSCSTCESTSGCGRLSAEAGPPQEVQCTANGEALVTLDGSRSTSVEGGLFYNWSAPVSLSSTSESMVQGIFPLGTHPVTLEVFEGPKTDVDTTTISVVDTLPPKLTAPPPVHSESCGSVSLGTPLTVDTCDGSLLIENDAPAHFEAGVTIVTWQATDSAGNFATTTQEVVVGLGDDPSCCPSGSNIILGTSENDTLIGTEGPDCIFGFGAQDTIEGLGGDDFLSGGEGDDILDGGEGNDFLLGGTAQDILRGGEGADTLHGGSGDDQIEAGVGNDSAFGGEGQDNISGEQGDDRLYGEAGDDLISGGDGDDLLVGGGLHDVCQGGLGFNRFRSCEQQSSSSCAPAMYLAEDMDHSTGGPTTDGWNLWTDGQVSTSHDFPGGSGYVGVWARGEYGVGAWPHMRVLIGDELAAEIVVDTTELTMFSVPWTDVSSTQEIRIEFDNDAYEGPDDDRNLIINAAVVRCDTPDPCADSVQNGEETDTDCGGPECAACEAGESCAVPADCLSGVCETGLCQEFVSCMNGTQDGVETDIDCGGGECSACEDGQGCTTGTDCLSGICDMLQCQAPMTTVFDFESSPQGWSNLGAPATGSWSSMVQASNGSHSLAVHVVGSGEPTVSVAPLASPPTGATVTLRVYIPAGAPVVAVSPYVLDNSWTWTDGYTTASPGAWQTLAVTVPSGAQLPLQRIGVKFYMNGSYNGSFYIDEVAW